MLAIQLILIVALDHTSGLLRGYRYVTFENTINSVHKNQKKLALSDVKRPPP